MAIITRFVPGNEAVAADTVGVAEAVRVVAVSRAVAIVVSTVDAGAATLICAAESVSVDVAIAVVVDAVEALTVLASKVLGTRSYSSRYRSTREDS